MDSDDLRVWINKLETKYNKKAPKGDNEESLFSEVDEILNQYGIPINKQKKKKRKIEYKEPTKYGTHVNSILISPDSYNKKRNAAKMPLQQKTSNRIDSIEIKPKNNEKKNRNREKKVLIKENNQFIPQEEQQMRKEPISMKKTKSNKKQKDFNDKNSFPIILDKPEEKYEIEKDFNTKKKVIIKKQDSIKEGLIETDVKVDAAPKRKKVDFQELQKLEYQYQIHSISPIFMFWKSKAEDLQECYLHFKFQIRKRNVDNLFHLWKYNALKQKKYRIAAEMRENVNFEIQANEVARKLYFPKYFQKWLIRINEIHDLMELEEEEEIYEADEPPPPSPIYSPPKPHVFKKKPRPPPIVADPKYDELAKKGIKEKKEEKIQQVKKKMKQDLIKKKQEDELKRQKEEKERRKHLKRLLVDRKKREMEKQNQDARILEQIKYQEMCFKAEDFHLNVLAKYFMKKWTQVLAKKESDMKRAYKHYKLFKLKNGLKAFLRNHQDTKGRQNEEAKMFYKKMLLKKSFVTLRSLHKIDQSDVDKVQCVLNTLKVRSVFNEWKWKEFELRRIRDMKAVEFRTNSLLRRAMRGFPLGTKAEKEEEKRQEFVQNLLNKAHEYLKNENLVVTDGSTTIESSASIPQIQKTIEVSKIEPIESLPDIEEQSSYSEEESEFF